MLDERCRIETNRTQRRSVPIEGDEFWRRRARAGICVDPAREGVPGHFLGQFLTKFAEAWSFGPAFRQLGVYLRRQMRPELLGNHERSTRDLNSDLVYDNSSQQFIILGQNIRGGTPRYSHRLTTSNEILEKNSLAGVRINDFIDRGLCVAKSKEVHHLRIAKILLRLKGELSHHVVNRPSREIELQNAGLNRLPRSIAELVETGVECPASPLPKQAWLPLAMRGVYKSSIIILSDATEVFVI